MRSEPATAPHAGNRPARLRCVLRSALVSLLVVLTLRGADAEDASRGASSRRVRRLPPVASAVVPASYQAEAVPTPEPKSFDFAPSALEMPVRRLGPVLTGPELSEPAMQPTLEPARLAVTDLPLPINLATALRLSDARPLVVAAAQAQIQIAAAQLEKARVLWLPDINAGNAYITHTGGQQSVTGGLVDTNTSFLYAGGSLVLRVATTDAIYSPLAARQELRARDVGLQTARNDALLATAEAYFTVHQARGSYAAMSDAVQKGIHLVNHIEHLSKGLTPRDEIYRARTLLAELEQAAATAQQEWRVASAQLTRVLRLNPEAVVVPLEPDHLQVSLVSQSAALDELIPLGLRNRPELASHRAVVEATLARLKQERMRPLIPSVLVTGNGTPDFLFQGGVFGTGSGSLDQWAGRSDVGVQVVWQAENLGFGNRALIRQRRGQMQLAMVELFEVQDRVAAEVTQAKAELESAAFRAVQAERGLKESLATYKGNLRGLGQTTRFGDLLTLVNRPQEVVAALTQLQQAYLNYYRSIADTNRAQFRLYYSLGFPSQILACQTPPGEVEPVDTMRPGYLPAVRHCPPCNYCR
ncbi:MAG: TolC family protein [Pirellulales bacterium]